MVAHRDAVKVFKALKREDAPLAIRTLLVPRTAVSTRVTRASDRGSLHLRKPKLAATKTAFAYRAAVAWNRLPPHVCAATTLNALKTALRDM